MKEDLERKLAEAKEQKELDKILPTFEDLFCMMLDEI